MQSSCLCDNSKWHSRRDLGGTGMVHHVKADHDRTMVGCLPQKSSGFQARHAPNQAPVDPQRNHVAGDVGMFAWAGVMEAGQQCRSDQIVIADHRGPVWQELGDPPKLPAVENLAMRQMHIGDRDRPKVDDLAYPVEHGAGLQWKHDGARMERHWAPYAKAVDAARHQVALELTTYAVCQLIHFPRDLLHQKKIGTFPPDQANDIVKGCSSQAEQIPAYEFDHRGDWTRLVNGLPTTCGQHGCPSTLNDERIRADS